MFRTVPLSIIRSFPLLVNSLDSQSVIQLIGWLVGWLVSWLVTWLAMTDKLNPLEPELFFLLILAHLYIKCE